MPFKSKSQRDCVSVLLANPRTFVMVASVREIAACRRWLKQPDDYHLSRLSYNDRALVMGVIRRVVEELK